MIYVSQPCHNATVRWNNMDYEVVFLRNSIYLKMISFLIFLVGEMLEKFLWRSDYIFGLSFMPENQSSKNFSILTSRFEGQVQTACSHHGPSAKWFVYLINEVPFIIIFTFALASRLVISCIGYCVGEVGKKVQEMAILVH